MMPKKTKKNQEMGISVPIKLEFSEAEKHILTVEMIEKSQVLNNLSEKTKEEEQLLSLINAILKFDKNKTIINQLDKIRYLKDVILHYRKIDTKINWNQYPALPSTPPAISVVPPPQAQNSTGISLSSSQLSAIKLKPVGAIQKPTQSVQIEKNQLSTPSLGEIQLAKQQLRSIVKEETQESKQAEQLKDFTEIKLKPIEPDNISLGQGISMDLDLAKKLARQRTKLQDNNIAVLVEINNDVGGLPPEATELLDSLSPYLTEEDLDNLEYELNEKNSMNQLNEENLKKIKNSSFYKIICPLLQDLKRYLSPERFTELNNEISIKHSKNQLDEKTLQEVEDRYAQSLRPLSIIPENVIVTDIKNPLDELDEQLENLQKLIDEPKSGSFSSNAPLSMQFKPNNHTPIIVGETFKPIPKM